MLYSLDDFLSNKQRVGSLTTKLEDFPHFPHFPPQRHLSIASFLGDFQPLSMHHVARNVACLFTKVVHHIRNSLRMSEVSGCLEPCQEISPCRSLRSATDCLTSGRAGKPMIAPSASPTTSQKKSTSDRGHEMTPI